VSTLNTAVKNCEGIERSLHPVWNFLQVVEIIETLLEEMESAVAT
jgi:hypothetical protein